MVVALVSEVFVESMQKAVTGLSAAFGGFIVVALVGGAAEVVTARSAACKDRLDLSRNSRWVFKRKHQADPIRDDVSTETHRLRV